MRILFLTDHMEAGGAETHLASLLRALRDRGHNVALLSEGGRLADALEREGIPQHRVRLSPRTPWHLLLLRRHLFRLVRAHGYEILHAHARLPALLLRGSRPWGVHTVVTVHAAFRRRWPLGRLSYWGERTVAVSEDLRSYVCDAYGVPAETVTVLHNGIDCSHFRESPEEERHPGEVLFLSRMDRDCARGAALLCEIAPTLQRSFPALRVRLLGGGSALRELRALSERANRHAGRCVVECLGAVEDPAPLLRRASVLVGVSRAALEGAASGCAVILCGDEGYLGILSPETLPQAMQSNLCCRGAPPARAALLERDLRRLLSSPDERRALGTFGAEAVRTHYDLTKTAEQTEALYRRLLPPPPTRRALIAGYAGCGNLGDDAILLGLAEAFRLLAPTLELTALCGNARSSSRRFGLPVRHRYDLLGIAGRLCQSDLLLLGGGTLLQNESSERSLRYYCFLLRLAKRFGCRAMLIASGVGQVRGTRGTRALREAVGLLDAASVREAEAGRTLLSLGLSPDRLSVGADAALLLPSPPSARTSRLLLEHGIEKGTPLLFFAPRGGESKERAALLVTAVRFMASRHGLLPVVAAMDGSEDAAAAAAAARATGGVLLRLREPGEAVAILRACEVALVGRLHGMILATVALVPAVGVPDEGKLGIFARTLGQRALSFEGLRVTDLAAALEEEWQARHARAAVLRQTVDEERKKAWEDLEKICSLIYNDDRNRQNL